MVFQPSFSSIFVVNVVHAGLRHRLGHLLLVEHLVDLGERIFAAAFFAHLTFDHALQHFDGVELVAERHLHVARTVGVDGVGGGHLHARREDRQSGDERG
jgi:hypothetical protein